MPRFVEATTGLPVDPSTATRADGTIRPGYRQAMDDGEYMSFSLAMMDSAKPTAQGIFLRDEEQSQDWGKQVRDYLRDNRGFMPSGAAIPGHVGRVGDAFGPSARSSAQPSNPEPYSYDRAALARARYTV